MGFYNEIRIINCEFTAIPASSFVNFGSVNYFSFEGGNMDSIDADAMLGLNVIKDSTLPTPKGTFALIDVDLVPGGLPTGWWTTRQADRQADTQTDTLTGRQTDRRTHRQTDRQTHRQSVNQTDRHTGRQTDRQTDRQAGRQTGRQAVRQTDRQTDRQTGTEAGVQAGRKTRRQAGRQAGRQRDRHAGRRAHGQVDRHFGETKRKRQIIARRCHLIHSVSLQCWRELSHHIVGAADVVTLLCWCECFRVSVRHDHS